MDTRRFSCFFEAFHYFCGDPCSHAIGWHVRINHGVCSDNAIGSDCNAGANDSTLCYPSSIFDENGFGSGRSLVFHWNRGILVVVRVVRDIDVPSD